MRKLGLILIGGLALLATYGAGAPVASAADPLADCEGQPKGARGFHVDTVPDAANEYADVYTGFAICGMSTSPSGEHGKKYYLITAGDMDAGGGGVKLRCANPRYAGNGHERYCEGTDLGAPYDPNNPIGPFVGSAHHDIQSCGAVVCQTWETLWHTNVSAVHGLLGIGTIQNPNCNKSTVIQCFSATDDLGYGVTHSMVEPCWAVTWCKTAKAPTIPDLDPQRNRYVMTVNEISNEPPIIGHWWYLEIGEIEGGPHPEQDYHQCKFANLDPNARDCGTDPANWVHKNGPVGAYKCTATKPEGYSVRVVTTKGNNYDACDPIAWH